MTFSRSSRIFSIIRGRGTALRLPAGATARAWPLQIEKIPANATQGSVRGKYLAVHRTDAVLIKRRFDLGFGLDARKLLNLVLRQGFRRTDILADAVDLIDCDDEVLLAQQVLLQQHELHRSRRSPTRDEEPIHLADSAVGGLHAAVSGAHRQTPFQGRLPRSTGFHCCLSRRSRNPRSQRRSENWRPPGLGRSIVVQALASSTRTCFHERSRAGPVRPGVQLHAGSPSPKPSVIEGQRHEIPPSCPCSFGLHDDVRDRHRSPGSGPRRRDAPPTPSRQRTSASSGMSIILAPFDHDLYPVNQVSV